MKSRGTLIVIGGHEDHDGEREILKEIARNIHGRGRLVLATIASHEPAGYLEKYQASLGDLGVKDVVELYVADRSEASLDEKLEALKGVKAVFFSGGDQLRITSQIGDTPLFKRIVEIYLEGGLIAGTSAGASALGETMLTRGESDSSSRLGDVHLAPGLGLIKNVIIDQHFAERGRIGRLIGAVAMNPRMLGIGIDEDTAVVMERGRFRVIGSGSVYIVDASGATRSNVVEGKEDEPLSVCGLTLHILSVGDTFSLRSREPKLRPSEESD